MLTARSIDYESQKRETTLRTVSFKKSNLNKSDNSEGLHKMIIEESLRSTKRKIGELKLQTAVSFKNPVLDVENNEVESNGDISFKELKPTITSLKPENIISSMLSSEPVAAAIKVQKVYKSYRTRRNLADSAVVVEELWFVFNGLFSILMLLVFSLMFYLLGYFFLISRRWKALDFAALRQSSVSFFDSVKSETAVSRWARARTRAAKVNFSTS